MLPDPTLVADVVVEAVKATVAPLLARLAATETALVALQATIAQAAKAEAAAVLERRVEALLADVGTVREKVAAVEVKTLQPGPPGTPGKDGADGLGFDELECVDDGTGMVLRLTRGDQVKSVALAIPYDRGPFRLEEAYAKGNCVVHNGYWIAKAATKGIRPGEGPGPWRLIQKSGR